MIVELNARSREVFRQIVDAYVATGEPVGSRTIARRLDEQISPATIRNVMSDLEELGYLEKPHTSAGRVPTDQGYRFYVDTLVRLREPGPRDRELIERETYRSSLHLSEQVLKALGMSEWGAQLTVARFTAHDERTLARQHAVYHDEQQLRQSALEAARELEGLFEQDRDDAAQVVAGVPGFSPSDVR